MRAFSEEAFRRNVTNGSQFREVPAHEAANAHVAWSDHRNYPPRSGSLRTRQSYTAGCCCQKSAGSPSTGSTQPQQNTHERSSGALRAGKPQAESVPSDGCLGATSSGTTFAHLQSEV